jgi:WD40 repeat protein
MGQDEAQEPKQNHDRTQKTSLLEELAQRKKEMLSQRRWQEAVDLLTQMLELLPDAELMAQKGFLLLQIQRYQEAEECFLQALALKPDLVQAREGLTRAQQQRQKAGQPKSIATLSGRKALDASEHTVVDTTPPTDDASAHTVVDSNPLGNASLEHTVVDSNPLGNVPVDMSMGAILQQESKALEALCDDKPRQFGRYQILQELGRGGMGRVYRAFDPELKREVALKTMLPGNDPQLMNRFMQEAAAMAKLSQPNIVKVYDMGTIANAHYFTMELINGKDLAHWLREGKMTIRRAVEIVRKVAHAIDYAHREGILHRDLKPSNIMLDQQGEPKIMDFGLAMEMDRDKRMSKSGAVLGTPAYMPPEQALGKRKEMDERSDVYSLGAVLYELITGCAPFRGSNAATIIAQVLDSTPHAPSRLSKKVPQEVENICLKCLEKEKDRRYQSAHELALDLERFLAGEPVLAMKPGLFYRLGKWVKKNRLAASLAIIFTLTLAISLTVYFIELKHAYGNVLIEKTRAEEATKAAVKERNKAEEQRKQAVANLVFSYVQQASSMWHTGYYQHAALLYAYAIEQGDGCDPSKQLSLPARLRLMYSFPGIPHRRLLWRDRHVLDRSLAFADADKLNFVSKDEIHMYDRTTGDTVRIKGTSNDMYSAAFSKSGKLAAIGTTDSGELHLWDLTTRTLLCTLQAHSGKVIHVAFSPDEKLLASASSDYTVRLWDVTNLADKPVTLEGHTDRVIAVTFSADGKTLASASDDRNIRLWNVQKHSLICTFYGHNDVIHDLVFSPDGRLIASSGDDSIIRLWDVNKKSLTMLLKGHFLGARALAFSPDSKTLASGGGESQVRLWDVESGMTKMVLAGHLNKVNSLAFSPDGQWLVSAGKDRLTYLWHLPGKLLHSTLHHAEDVSGLAFNSDGTILASSGGDKALRFWDEKDGSYVQRLPPPLYPAKIYSMAVGNGRLGQFVAATRQEKIEIRELHSKKVWATLLQPNLTQPDLMRPDIALSVAFSPDASLLAAGFLYGKVYLWEMDGQSLKWTLEGQSASVRSLAFSHDGRFLACGSDGDIHIWNLDYRKQPAILVVPPPFSTRSLAFRPDGKVLASAHEDCMVRLWYPPWQSGKESVVLQGHASRVNSVAFSADGKMLASGSDDQMVRLWDSGSRELYHILQGNPGGVSALSFHPQKPLLACGGNDNNIFLWHILTAPEFLTVSAKEIKEKVENACGFRLGPYLLLELKND